MIANVLKMFGNNMKLIARTKSDMTQASIAIQDVCKCLQVMVMTGVFASEQ